MLAPTSGPHRSRRSISPSFAASAAVRFLGRNRSAWLRCRYGVTYLPVTPASLAHLWARLRRWNDRIMWARMVFHDNVTHLAVRVSAYQHAVLSRRDRR